MHSPRPLSATFGGREGVPEAQRDGETAMSLVEKVAVASAIIALLTAIFTGVAGGAAWWSVRTARRAAEAAACLRLFERYESDRMLWALRTLRTSKPTDVDVTHWAAQWVTEMHKKEPDRAQWAKDIDLARREVSGYFLGLTQIYDGGLVTRSLVRTAGYVAGINLFYELCEPLERALNPADYSEHLFRLLERIVGRHGSGRQEWGRIAP